MIIKRRDDSTLSATVEDADDLLALRRVVRRGDTVTGTTTRVIKRDRDYARPDRGERVKLTLSITAEKISLDGTLERLRIGGVVSESSSEDAVSHGAHHSMNVSISDTISITKRGRSGGDVGGKAGTGRDKSGWSRTDLRILKGDTKSGGRTKFILVAVDTGDCAVAVLNGTHLELSPNMYSGMGGKRYKTSRDMGDFFDRIVSHIASVSANDAGGRGGTVILFGPGNTKRKLANHMSAKKARNGGGVSSIKVVDGIDSGGQDGIHIFSKSDAMREAMAGSKLARVSEILDHVMEMAHRKIPRYAMGYEETYEAARAGAIDSMIFSDGALQQYGSEQEVIDLLNMAEDSGAEVYGVDSSTDIGLRTSAMGGMVALLRYALR